MKQATLTRNLKLSGQDGTFSDWLSESGFRCVTAERPRGASLFPAIPAGCYLAELAVSPHFYQAGSDFGYGRGVVYNLRNVPGREHILIHPANWPVPIKTEAEAEHYQLQGCIAPGAAVASIQAPAPDGRLLRGVTSSVFATRALMADMGGQPFYLTLKEEA